MNQSSIRICDNCNRQHVWGTKCVIPANSYIDCTSHSIAPNAPQWAKDLAAGKIPDHIKNGTPDPKLAKRKTPPEGRVPNPGKKS